MDVRIGVANTPKELDIELADDANAESLQKDITEAMSSESQVLWLTDRKGRTVGVPVDKLAYIEIGPQAGSRRIGFVG